MYDAFQRAGLRGGLALGAALGGPIVAHGQRMDPFMSALVRFANRAQSGNGTIGLSALRAKYARGPALTGLRRERTVQVQALTAAGQPSRRYEPPGPIMGSVLYFHGGGFILGSLDTHDPLCRRLALRAGVRVVSVAYRLAPEHPFPAAHDDAAAAWRWAMDALPKPLIVAGDSAGANLAAGVALSGEARLQLLLYPAVDTLLQDGLYPSIELFQQGFLLTAEGMRECARLLLPPGQDAGDPRLSPIRADLSRASPALIVTAGFDPLRDQGPAYAEALRRAGRRAVVVCEAGLVHGFADFAGVVPEARRAVDRMADALRTELV